MEAKGERYAVLNVRLVGMWSDGRGPFVAKLERFRAVRTSQDRVNFSMRDEHRQELTIQDDGIVCSIDVEALS